MAYCFAPRVKAFCNIAGIFFTFPLKIWTLNPPLSHFLINPYITLPPPPLSFIIYIHYPISIFLGTCTNNVIKLNFIKMQFLKFSSLLPAGIGGVRQLEKKCLNMSVSLFLFSFLVKLYIWRPLGFICISEAPLKFILSLSSGYWRNEMLPATFQSLWSINTR